jgi:hypothetical protein
MESCSAAEYPAGMVSFKSFRISIFSALAAFAALAACSDRNAQTGPGGLTPDDARALDTAAEKLDAKALPMPAPLQPALPTQANQPTKPQAAEPKAGDASAPAK